METPGTVMVMFYWGGRMIHSEHEGLSYDIPPKGLFRVQCPMSVTGLEEMLMPKVAKNGEIGQLKFTCRYPQIVWHSDVKYMPLPINDDETLSNLLGMTAKFPSCPEIYVEFEFTYRQDQMTLLGSSSFVEMLSQETLPSSERQSMPFIDTHATDIGGCSMPSLCSDDPGRSSDGPNSDGRFRRVSFRRNEYFGMSTYGDHVDLCGVDENLDEDVDTLLTHDEHSDSDVDDDPDNDGGGTLNVPTNLDRASNIPYYHNIDLGNDGSVCPRHVAHRGPRWDASTAKLEHGMVFKDKLHLQHAVASHHIKINRQYKVIDSRKRVWVVECKNGCSWRMRATKRKHGFFEIMQLRGDHTCVYNRVNRDHNNLSSRLIAESIKTEIDKELDKPLATIIETVKQKFEFTISYKKAWLARTRAIELLFGSWDGSYQKLPRYLRALKTYNVGTVVNLVVKSARSPHEVFMDYVFWAFKPSIDGFVLCPPLICIDGTHLYGKFKGKLLVATAVTVASNILPLAFAIVDKETSEAWGWFLMHLRLHVCPGRENVTLISDRGSGIMSAIPRVWESPLHGQPIGYHRWCVRHVTSNFNSAVKNQELKDLLMTACIAHQKRKMNRALEEIKTLSAEAYKWIQDHLPDPKKWALSHNEGRRWGLTTTNHVESFNGVLKGARNIPITSSVEITFHHLVKYFDKYRVMAEQDERNGYKYQREWQKKLEESQIKANVFNLRAFDWTCGHFEVLTAPRGTKGYNKQVVRLDKAYGCSCGKYEIYRFPCSHMLAVTAELGVDSFKFVHEFYKLPVYKRVWERKFEPIPHEDYWADPPGPILLLDPARRREPKPGRQKLNRIHNEMDATRQRMSNHCSVCQQTGHDKRRCPQRLPRISHQ